MPTLGYVVLILFAVVGWVVAFIYWKRHRIRKLAASRTGDNFETFRLSFAEGEVPDDVLKAVYQTFQECHTNIATFPVCAEDVMDVYWIYEPEDMREAVFFALQKCGRRFPPDFPEPFPAIIETVRDFAHFVESCPIKPTPRSA